MTSSTPVFKITPGIQSYDWGKKGSSSLAAQLATTCIESFSVDENKTYAELWMGTHSTLPSKLAGSDVLLSEHIKKHPEFLHQSIIDAYPNSKEGQLPFLFKVLSIGTSLSVQAHPNKKLAERLHAERGDIYKDPNHKPEMAIALTPFLAFLSFLPLPTILQHLVAVPELSRLIPSEQVQALASSISVDTSASDLSNKLAELAKAKSAFANGQTNDDQKAALKAIFGSLMSTAEQDYKSAVADLVKRYESGTDIKDSEKHLVELVKLLNEQYPGDIGVLCVFVLNVVELEKGQAAFLGADEPHAYLKGDIIECMATSDNVVRAGLTPKLRDVPTLVSMLTYESGDGSASLQNPVDFSKPSSSASSLYDPPIKEFSVVRIEVSDKAEEQRAINGPSIVIVTKGSGAIAFGQDKVEIKRGEVIFIGAETSTTWSSENGEGLEVFRAFVEV